MRLMVISDIHGNVDRIRQLLPHTGGIDCLVAAGDITHFGGYADAAKVINPVLEYLIPVMAVAGNCDTDGVEDYLEEKQIHVGREGRRLGEFVFVGAGGSLPCPKQTPREFGDDVLETVLCRSLGQGSQGDALVVISHQPAYGTKVDSVGGHFTGSQGIRKFIETHHPILAVSGHIHEAFGTDRIGQTVLVNPGPLKDGRYAIVDIRGMDVQTELRRLD